MPKWSLGGEARMFGQTEGGGSRTAGLVRPIGTTPYGRPATTRWESGWVGRGHDQPRVSDFPGFPHPHSRSGTHVRVEQGTAQCCHGRELVLKRGGISSTARVLLRAVPLVLESSDVLVSRRTQRLSRPYDPRPHYRPVDVDTAPRTRGQDR